MACPKCGCKVSYAYNPEWDGMGPTDDRLERCAACRHVFDIEDSADEDDDADGVTRLHGTASEDVTRNEGA